MREKLIALLDEASLKLKELCGGYNDGTGNTVRADHLIANGVTIQRWIPVTEQLPEMRGDGFADAYLVTDGHLGHLAYFVDGEWFFTENGEMKEPMFYDVTHWMPLPPAPEDVK